MTTQPEHRFTTTCHPRLLTGPNHHQGGEPTMGLRIKASHEKSLLQMNGTWVIIASTDTGDELRLALPKTALAEVADQLDERRTGDGTSSLLVRLVIQGEHLADDAHLWGTFQKTTGPLDPPSEPERTEHGRGSGD